MFPMSHRELPCQFNPRSGRRLAAPDWQPAEFRFRGDPWIYDPWTGDRRPRNQVKADPWGVLLTPGRRLVSVKEPA